MNSSFTREFMIPPGCCDSSARLGVPDAFSLCMDAAAEHACLLGCGFDAMGPRGLFWLTVRTRLRFYRRPAVLERVRLTTWPERRSRTAPPATRATSSAGRGGAAQAGCPSAPRCRTEKPSPWRISWAARSPLRTIRRNPRGPDRQYTREALE